MRPVYLLLGATLVVAAGVAVGRIRAARDRAFDEGWARLSAGMTKEEVCTLVGRPDTVYPAQKSSSLEEILVNCLLFDARREKWAYGRRRGIALRGDFPYIGLAWDEVFAPRDDDHVIYFTRDGRVAKSVYPYRPTTKTAGPRK